MKPPIEVLAHRYDRARSTVKAFKLDQDITRGKIVDRIGVDVTETHGDYRVTTTKVECNYLDQDAFMDDLRRTVGNDVVDHLVALHTTVVFHTRLNVTKVSNDD